MLLPLSGLSGVFLFSYTNSIYHNVTLNLTCCPHSLVFSLIFALSHLAAALSCRQLLFYWFSLAPKFRCSDFFSAQIYVVLALSHRELLLPWLNLSSAPFQPLSSPVFLLPLFALVGKAHILEANRIIIAYSRCPPPCRSFMLCPFLPPILVVFHSAAPFRCHCSCHCFW